MDGDTVAPRSARSGDGDGGESEEILGGEGFFGMGGNELFGGAGEDNLATKASGSGTDIDDIVGSAHDVFVVLDDDNGVAKVAELLEDADETMGVAGVEADRGFVEDVHAADQRAAKGGGEVDALGFAPAKGVGRAVEGEVSQSDIEEVAHAGGEFGEESANNLSFVGGEGGGH